MGKFNKGDNVHATEAWGSNNLPPTSNAIVLEVYEDKCENEYVILVENNITCIVYEYEIEVYKTAQ